MEEIIYGLNGAFTVIYFDGKYLFIKRKDKGTWDLPGGGFDPSETNFTLIAIREAWEEIGLKISEEQMVLYAVLGQRLRKEAREKYNTEKGLLFLQYVILHEEPIINLGNEHTEYRLFSYTEIIANWKSFSSGPLWIFFAFLNYQQTHKIQKGELREYSVWQGIDYR
jgi:8-oxo-dGTP pyrophosphatase MutT (NUDIX family)